MTREEKIEYLIKLLIGIGLTQEKIVSIKEELSGKADNEIDEITIKLEQYYQKQNILDKEFIKNLDKINNQIDESYNIGTFNFDKGTNKISDEERKTLVKQLVEVVRGFNAEIARIEQEYIGETDKNTGQIRNEIADYFADKSLFVEKGAGLASALRGYSSMDREAAKTQREKELPLN